MEYYSVIKKNELLSFAITWMELEWIMLSKISPEKDKYRMISLTWNIGNKTDKHRRRERNIR